MIRYGELAAAFAAYCRVIDEFRHAAVLTYRESKSLDAAGREQIKRLEVETSQPLREAVRAGVEAGVFVTDDSDLVAYDLLLLAHSWALKHWYFEQTKTLDSYIRAQLALALRAIVVPTQKRKYADLLTPDRHRQRAPSPRRAVLSVAGSVVGPAARPGTMRVL